MKYYLYRSKFMRDVSLYETQAVVKFLWLLVNMNINVMDADPEDPDAMLFTEWPRT